MTRLSHLFEQIPRPAQVLLHHELFRFRCYLQRRGQGTVSPSVKRVGSNALALVRGFGGNREGHVKQLQQTFSNGTINSSSNTPDVMLTAETEVTCIGARNSGSKISLATPDSDTRRR